MSKPHYRSKSLKIPLKSLFLVAIMLMLVINKIGYDSVLSYDYCFWCSKCPHPDKQPCWDIYHYGSSKFTVILYVKLEQLSSCLMYKKNFFSNVSVINKKKIYFSNPPTLTLLPTNGWCSDWGVSSSKEGQEFEFNSWRERVFNYKKNSYLTFTNNFEEVCSSNKILVCRWLWRVNIWLTKSSLLKLPCFT